MFRSLDNFGSSIPAFNLKGKDKVTTIAGGLLTSMILTLTLAYAVQNLFAVFERSDPTINENEIAKFYNNDYGLNIRESNMRFAISYHAYEKAGSV